MTLRPLLFSILLICCAALEIKAQDTAVLDYFQMNYQRPKKYTIGAIKIEGARTLDTRILRLVIGLRENQEITIPGDEITKALNNLWKQKYFTDIKVIADSVADDVVTLKFLVEEKPRLRFKSIGGSLTKKQTKKLNEQLSLQTNQVLTDNVKQNTEREIINFYVEKGYLSTKVTFEEIPAEKNMVDLKIKVVLGPKVKVNDILIAGNHNIETKALLKRFKNTKRKKWWRVFKRSKYNKESYEEDKAALLSFYNARGFRDAQIISDTLYMHNRKSINLQLNVFEGHKFYFRNVHLVGNSKYASKDLETILNIKPGDEYNLAALERNLFMSPTGTDISSLYMDDGYLFFQVTPVEVLVENDSIDLEIRIVEGPQATINKVTVKGNTKTSDRVILRELRTLPGQKFSRSDIQRSIRDLAASGNFNPETMDVKPTPNPANGTVDIEYIVEEKSNDQIELSGGFGSGTVVGTLGLTLNNFSTRKLFKPKEWSPVPGGDGQRLSLRAQSNGNWYKAYNFSFTEPWFGGKKPNALTLAVWHSIQTNGVTKTQERDGSTRSYLKVTGASIGLGKRLKWPDDYFVLNYSLNYQYYDFKNSTSLPLAFENGISNSLTGRLILTRSSISDPYFPRNGSTFTFSVQATPPVSRINKIDYRTASEQEKFKWLEYHKWKFDAYYYIPLDKKGKLVIANMLRSGFMGYYNKDIGFSPFERFYLGGSGLTGFNLDGRELIAFRGYQDNSVTPRSIQSNGSLGNQTGGTIFNRFSTELRYLISPNPSAMIYVLTFFEAANSWDRFKSYNPYNLLRSAGGGVRIFLPMFGLLGVDYGYGFDQNPYQPNSGGGQFHFFIGQQF